jgi:hypothetical protein
MRAILCALDLLEIDGEDLRRAHRKHRLARGSPEGRFFRLVRGGGLDAPT